MSSRDLKATEIQANLERTLANLIISYSAIRNRTGFNNIVNLLNRYFSNDPSIKPFLEKYKF
jgi:hypothetical protein